MLRKQYLFNDIVSIQGFMKKNLPTCQKKTCMSFMEVGFRFMYEGI